MTFEVAGDGFSVNINYDEHQGLPLWNMLVDIERTILSQTLERFGQNKSQAAAHLHLNRTTLVEKARKYGFSTPQMPE